MNYNRLYDQMLFINEKGDTLALTEVKNIEFIVNDWDVFYYSGGYLRLIADDTIIKLPRNKSGQLQMSERWARSTRLQIRSLSLL
jgi:hypothetical protein